VVRVPESYQHPYDVGRLRLFDEALDRLSSTARSVIELGSHNGETTGHLARRFDRVVAVDIDAAKMDAAKARPALAEVEFLLHDLNQPLPAAYEGAFDLVVALEIIEHLASPATFLAHTLRLLRPSGALLISTPNLMSPEALVGGFWARRDGKKYDAWDRTHTKLFTSPELIRLLRKQGFAPRKITGYHYGTPPLPLLGKKLAPTFQSSSRWPLNHLGFNVIVEAAVAR